MLSSTPKKCNMGFIGEKCAHVVVPNIFYQYWNFTTLNKYWEYYMHITALVKRLVVSVLDK